MFKKLFKKKKKEERTKVGVGVMILKDGKVLLGKRKGSHGAGEYAFPGGHLEYMEFFEDCAKRETFEEAGIEIKNIKFQCIANTKKWTPKHYVHIGVIAELESGEPKVLEPEKCEGWDWYDIENLPEPIFNLVLPQIEAYKSGKNYYDKE